MIKIDTYQQSNVNLLIIKLFFLLFYYNFVDSNIFFIYFNEIGGIGYFIFQF